MDFEDRFTYSVVFVSDWHPQTSHIRARTLRLADAVLIAKSERSNFRWNPFVPFLRGKNRRKRQKDAIQIIWDVTGERVTYPDGSYV